MIDKTIFYESMCYKVYSVFINAYGSSVTKRALDKLAFYTGESVVGKACCAFAHKESYMNLSLYQKFLDKVSVFLSVIMSIFKSIFFKLAEGSIFCRVYSSFLKSTGESKLRMTGVFGFYLFLNVTALMAFSFSPFTVVCAIAALLFLLVSLTSKKIVVIFENSFFVKLFMELIK